jgi:lactate dehydrogenase-like 2-hydroxyacid dehydrogenase
MAREVDTLIAIVPGGAATKNMIDAQVLEALGPNGILINVARGSVIDEPALVSALRERKIMAAGLDVFVNEPQVPEELLALDNVVLLPHLGSASVFAREKMDQLLVDNILAWADGKPPLTPVPETPWRSWREARLGADRGNRQT